MNRNRIGTKTLHNSMETRCETSCTDSSFVIVLENYSRVIPTNYETIYILSHFFTSIPNFCTIFAQLKQF